MAFRLVAVGRDDHSFERYQIFFKLKIQFLRLPFSGRYFFRNCLEADKRDFDRKLSFGEIF